MCEMDNQGEGVVYLQKAVASARLSSDRRMLLACVRYVISCLWFLISCLWYLIFCSWALESGGELAPRQEVWITKLSLTKAPLLQPPHANLI